MCSKITLQNQCPGDVLEKKVFLQISQNSPDNNCAKAYFLIKLQDSACAFIKKATLAQVFSCEFWKTSNNIFSYGTPLMAAFYSKGSRIISLTLL